MRTALSELERRLDPDKKKWSVTELTDRKDRWRSQYADGFKSDAYPLRPERVVSGAREVLPDGTIIVSDPGTSCPYFAAFYPFRTIGRTWVTPRAHGALGYAIPGAVGAHYARPDAEVIGFTGDGSAGMTVGELETLARLDIPVTVVVINNGAYSWIEAGQQNYDEFSFAVDFDSYDYAAVAEEVGISGFRVSSSDDYERTLREAFEFDGPALIDVPVQPLSTIDDVPVTWLEPDD